MVSNTKKNILFMTARLPYPIIGGDRLKPNYLLQHLSSKYNVTLVSFYQGASLPQEYRNHFENMGIDLRVVLLNPKVTALKMIPKILSKPLEILYYLDNKFQIIVDEVIKSKKIDLTFAFFMRTAEYIKNKNIPKILIAEDCRTVYQKRSFEESTDIKQRLIRNWEWKKLLKYEPKLINHFDRVTFVSKEDIEHSKKLNSKPEYRLLTNGTDINKFIGNNSNPSEKTERKDIIFAGKLDVWANELMCKKIVEDILPIIKQTIPDIKFKIVGANPTANIKSFISENIILYENVDDMIPYLQNAAIFLHPHAGGSGIQNKLLEAMSCECPVVTTPTGNQGIHALDGESIMIGNSPEELAKKSIQILSDSSLANSIGRNARNLIVNTHSWETVYTALEEIINEVIK